MSDLYPDLPTVWQACTSVLNTAVAATLIAAIAGVITALPLLFTGHRTPVRPVPVWPVRLLALPVAVVMLEELQLIDVLQPQVLTLAVVQWPFYFWSVHALALNERHKPYIEAAVCLALGRQRILFGHLLPNCMPPLAIISLLYLADAIVLIVLLGGLHLNYSAPAWITWQHEALVPAVPAVLAALVLYGIGGRGLRRYQS